MTRGATVAIVLALAAPAAADGERWDPTTVVNAGAQAGFEGPPGMLVLVEAGVGHRIGGRVWHLRGAYPVVAAEPLTGGSVSFSYRLWDVRVGPTWWRCAGETCVGLDLDGGLEYFTTHARGGDGPEPLDNTRHDYDAIADLRIRYLAVGIGDHVAVEANIGFRLKVRTFSTGDHVPEGPGRLGAGILIGVGCGTAF